MKLQPNNIIWCFLLFFSALSCTKEVIIEIPRGEEKLVINSLFSPQKPITVHLSKSSYIYDNPSDGIDGAKVEIIYESGMSEFLNQGSNGQYFAQIKPEFGEIYKLKVSLNGFKEIESMDSIPFAPKVNSVYRRDNVAKDENGSSYSQFEIEFTDDKSKKDYYEIIAYFIYNDAIYDIIENDTIYLFRDTLQGLALLSSDDPIIKTEMQIDPTYGEKYLLFDDELINGKNYKLVVNYRTIFSPQINTDYKLFIHFNQVSADYYEYKKKLYLYRLNAPGFWNNSGDIVNVHSNIKNGYGIFAAFNSYVDTLNPVK